PRRYWPERRRSTARAFRSGPSEFGVACNLYVDVRLRPDELEEIRRDVMKSGRQYSDDNLDGATIDGDYGLDDFGFTSPTITKTGDLKQMVLYECRPSPRSP